MTNEQYLAMLKSYPLAAGLVVAAALMAGLAYFRSDSLALAEEEFATLEKQFEVMKTNRTASDSLKSNLAQLREDLKQIQSCLIDPAPRNISRNKEFFRDFERSTGIVIVDSAQERTLPLPDANNKPPANLKEPNLVTLTTFTVTASGTWEQIADFLYGMDTSPRLLRLMTFRVGKDNRQAIGPRSSDDRLSATLKVEMLGTVVQ